MPYLENSFVYSINLIFLVDGHGAGFGNLEIIVNGGKVTSHVSTVEPQKKFSANFIPHEAGRHRVDVKFNGEKIGSPRFVEVLDIKNSGYSLDQISIIYSRF